MDSIGLRRENITRTLGILNGLVASLRAILDDTAVYGEIDTKIREIEGIYEARDSDAMDELERNTNKIFKESVDTMLDALNTLTVQLTEKKNRIEETESQMQIVANDVVDTDEERIYQDVQKATWNASFYYGSIDELKRRMSALPAIAQVFSKNKLDYSEIIEYMASKLVPLASSIEKLNTESKEAENGRNAIFNKVPEVKGRMEQFKDLFKKIQELRSTIVDINSWSYNHLGKDISVTHRNDLLRIEKQLAHGDIDRSTAVAAIEAVAASLDALLQGNIEALKRDQIEDEDIDKRMKAELYHLIGKPGMGSKAYIDEIEDKLEIISTFFPKEGERLIGDTKMELDYLKRVYTNYVKEIEILRNKQYEIYTEIFNIPEKIKTEIREKRPIEIFRIQKKALNSLEEKVVELSYLKEIANNLNNVENDITIIERALVERIDLVIDKNVEKDMEDVYFENARLIRELRGGIEEWQREEDMKKERKQEKIAAKAEEVSVPKTIEEEMGLLKERVGKIAKLLESENQSENVLNEIARVKYEMQGLLQYGNPIESEMLSRLEDRIKRILDEDVISSITNQIREDKKLIMEKYRAIEPFCIKAADVEKAKSDISDIESKLEYLKSKDALKEEHKRVGEKVNILKKVIDAGAKNCPKEEKQFREEAQTALKLMEKIERIRKMGEDDTKTLSRLVSMFDERKIISAALKKIDDSMRVMITKKRDVLKSEATELNKISQDLGYIEDDADYQVFCIRQEAKRKEAELKELSKNTALHVYIWGVLQSVIQKLVHLVSTVYTRVISRLPSPFRQPRPGLDREPPLLDPESFEYDLDSPVLGPYSLPTYSAPPTIPISPLPSPSASHAASFGPVPSSPLHPMPSTFHAASFGPMPPPSHTAPPSKFDDDETVPERKPLLPFLALLPTIVFLVFNVTAYVSPDLGLIHALVLSPLALCFCCTLNVLLVSVTDTTRIETLAFVLNIVSDAPILVIMLIFTPETPTAVFLTYLCYAVIALKAAFYIFHRDLNRTVDGYLKKKTTVRIATIGLLFCTFAVLMATSSMDHLSTFHLNETVVASLCFYTGVILGKKPYLLAKRALVLLLPILLVLCYSSYNLHSKFQEAKIVVEGMAKYSTKQR